ncbi:MAG: toxin-antitoxin system HicB family antitoxin [Clostridia bacterium]|jgi:hypothetical protein|nr:toxin-antitoxin system HicB family antitoxin [Clostridia bacterium]
MEAKKSFPLRMNPQLYAVMERWAADEFRSVNAQIEFVLREAARKADRLPGKEAKEGRVAKR